MTWKDVIKYNTITDYDYPIHPAAVDAVNAAIVTDLKFRHFKILTRT